MPQLRKLFNSYKWRRRRSVLPLLMTLFTSSLLPSVSCVRIRQRNGNDHHSQEEGQQEGEKMTTSFQQDFMKWARESLEINTDLVEIRTFPYYDYIQAMADRIDVFYEEETLYYNSFYTSDKLEQQQEEEYYDDDDDDDRLLSILDYPTISTRGLAASRDIQVGEIVLQIPHKALWTVSNRIDKDPILSQVIGMHQRQQYGWDSQVDEIPLLAVALLYHFQLYQEQQRYKLYAEEDEEEEEYYDPEEDDPYRPYLQLLQDTNVHDRIPHLWNSQTLRQSATVGVRKVSKGIQKDVKELYQRIVMPLIQNHPDIFDDHTSTNSMMNTNHHQEEEEEYYEEDEHHGGEQHKDEWLFSLEKFHWAFALVNSRHWHLPIPDDTNDNDDNELSHADNSDLLETADSSETEEPVNTNIQFDESASPPAAMPTDEWMDLQQQVEQRRDEELQQEQEANTLEQDAQQDGDNNEWPEGNSFLAPVADLLNFGPPCTRGVYNTTTHTFDILATCNINKGQEITFWYADACQDVFMANYGFTLPMLVPTCQSYNDGSSMSKNDFINLLEHELLFTLDELDKAELEMDRLVTVLESCNCGDNKKAVLFSNNETVLARMKDIASPVPPPAKQQSEEEEQPKSTKRTTPTTKKKETIARHAIRGANTMSPSSPPSNAKSPAMSSNGLTRSQKRQQRRQKSIRDL